MCIMLSPGQAFSWWSIRPHGCSSFWSKGLYLFKRFISSILSSYTWGEAKTVFSAVVVGAQSGIWESSFWSVLYGKKSLFSKVAMHVSINLSLTLLPVPSVDHQYSLQKCWPLASANSTRPNNCRRWNNSKRRTKIWFTSEWTLMHQSE